MTKCTMGSEGRAVEVGDGRWGFPCTLTLPADADRLYPLARCARTGDWPRGHLRCRERGGRALYPGDVRWPDRRPAAHKAPCVMA